MSSVFAKTLPTINNWICKDFGFKNNGSISS